MCCRCNGGGKCKNCVCAKANRRCMNCLPSKRGCCSNTTQNTAQTALAQSQDVPVCIDINTGAPRHSILPSAHRNSPGNRSSTPVPVALPSVAPVGSNSPGNDSHITPINTHSLPAPTPLATPMFVWGQLDASTFIPSLEATYNEVVHWKRNTFLVPYGAAGKKFVSELSRLYRAYAEGSALESVALKATTVMALLLLQKPFQKSKPRDHSTCLERRMKSWAEGDFHNLLFEGRSIQSRFQKNNSIHHDEKNLVHNFTKLMFQGKTSAALDLLTRRGKGGVLHATKVMNDRDSHPQTVLDILQSKHPHAQAASPESLPAGHPEAPLLHPVVFDQIDATAICSATLRTRGAAGPSLIVAHCWRRLCTSFTSASQDLCLSLALLARRICSTFVDPKGLAAFLACRLIALDKCPGVRSIGICETARRIVSKAVLLITRADLQEAVGPLQLCAGQTAGTEAAIHALRASFQQEETEAVLLVDATNAFNALNRESVLHNIRYLCPALATILINIYRDSSDLYVDGHTLLSEEGTTQGDPLVMPMYALATIPLIKYLSSTSSNMQVWYADDAAASGSLTSLRVWWDNLTSAGPAFGYFGNAKKTWLVTKDTHLENARNIFQDTQVNITSDGRAYLGSAIGSDEFTNSFVIEKVHQWKKELTQLVDVATWLLQPTHMAMCTNSHICVELPPTLSCCCSPWKNTLNSISSLF